MRREHCLIIVLCLVCCLLVWQQAGPVMAQDDPDELLDSLEREEQRARDLQQSLLTLSEEERAVHSDLTGAEDELAALEASVAGDLEELAQAEEREAEVQGKLDEVLAFKQATVEEINILLRKLWPVHVRNMAGRGRDLESWEEADREFTWMAGVYRMIRGKVVAIEEQETEIRMVLEEMQQASAEVRDRVASVNTSKEALLQKRLDFMNRLAEVRDRQIDEEERLKLVVASIEDIRFQLDAHQAPEGVPFKELKGKLPWPVEGTVALDWGPNLSPPRRGLGIAVDEGQTVKAVYWGKVVHDDTLRGFGRVIIVLHDDDYYSLYAFLSDSQVRPGQNVVRGQPLGTAGFYPEVKGPGLYFELRYQQKAINPDRWLSAR